MSCLEPFSVLNQVSSYFSCLAKCWNSVLLWSSRNVFWTTRLHLTSHQHEDEGVASQLQERNQEQLQKADVTSAALIIAGLWQQAVETMTDRSISISNISAGLLLLLIGRTDLSLSCQSSLFLTLKRRKQEGFYRNIRFLLNYVFVKILSHPGDEISPQTHQANQRTEDSCWMSGEMSATANSVPLGLVPISLKPSRTHEIFSLTPLTSLKRPQELLELILETLDLPWVLLGLIYGSTKTKYFWWEVETSPAVVMFFVHNQNVSTDMKYENEDKRQKICLWRNTHCQHLFCRLGRNTAMFLLIYFCTHIISCMQVHHGRGISLLLSLPEGFFREVFPDLNQRVEGQNVFSAVQSVKAPWGKLWFVILGLINKTDLTLLMVRYVAVILTGRG